MINDWHNLPRRTILHKDCEAYYLRANFGRSEQTPQCSRYNSSHDGNRSSMARLRAGSDNRRLPIDSPARTVLPVESILEFAQNCLVVDRDTAERYCSICGQSKEPSRHERELRPGWLARRFPQSIRLRVDNPNRTQHEGKDNPPPRRPCQVDDARGELQS